MRLCSMFVLLYIVRKLENVKSGCNNTEVLGLEGSSAPLTTQSSVSQGRQNKELFRTLFKICPK